MGTRRLAIIVFASLALALFATGCGLSRSETGSPSPSASGVTTEPTSTSSVAPSSSVSPSPSTSTSASPSTTRTVSVYFLRGNYVGVTHRQVNVAATIADAALEALLAGPTAEEQAAGLHTQIPPGTELLGLTVADGVATVDLSGEFGAGVDPIEDRGRLGEVVYTLTQFPSIESVNFRLDGKPLVFRRENGSAIGRPQSRLTFEDVTPAILVERPAVNDTVESPLVVSGTANTFEAQLMVRVRDGEGNTLVSESAMATSGSGTRGTFNETLRFSATTPTITLEVYEISAASGRPIHVVSIPLNMVSASASPSSSLAPSPSASATQ